MNKTKVLNLLDQWTVVITIGRNISGKKAEQIDGGLSGRIKRITGTPVIFDLETHEKQIKIQKLLCEELPQWINLINSKPAIGGYAWTRKDYIELYFNHFRLVVGKLHEIISRQITV